MLTAKQFGLLRILSVIGIVLMVVHDIDHARVTYARGYGLHWTQMITVFIAYLPSASALFLVTRGSPLSALAAFTSGAVLLIGFTFLHLIGTSAVSAAFDPFLYEWRDSFCSLKVDYLTWLSFWANFAWAAITMACGLSLLAGQLRLDAARA